MAGEHGGVGVEVDRLLVGPGRHAEPAADVDLGDRVAVGDQAAARSRRPARAPPRTPASPSRRASRSRRGSGSCRSSGRGGAAAASASGEPVLVDPELRRPVAAVGEARVVAGAGGRVDPEPDRPARRPPADPLDLADRVEVEVDRLRRGATSRSRSETFVPVKLISSAGQPHSSARTTSPGEQASIPTSGRRTSRIRGSGLALSAKRSRMAEPGGRRAPRRGARAFSAKRSRS